MCNQNIIQSIFPLHNTDQLCKLQSSRILAFFDSQPLNRVKDYFGTEIALYFAWLNHFTIALTLPALLGSRLFAIEKIKNFIFRFFNIFVLWF